MPEYRRSRGTTVPVSRTRAQIAELLDSLKNPDGKGIGYGFDNANSSVLLRYHGIPIRMRVDSDARFEAIKSEYKRAPHKGWKAVREQAEREAWRNLLDYLKITITLINDGQFRLSDLFLSFVEIPSRTGEPRTIGDYFEEQGKLEAIASGRLALPEPKG